MPELPDIELYVTAIAERTVGRELSAVRIKSPFVLRTFDPPPSSIVGRKVTCVRRLGKRVVLGLSDGLFLAIHLMIAGRFRWGPAGALIPGKIGLAAFDFTGGTLLLTEASTRKRAALHLVRGAEALAALDRGGIEVGQATLEAFRAALLRENHTLKRALTDPRLFSGIGNAYSDEILHAAGLSPVKRTEQLTVPEIVRLHDAARRTLEHWTERLRHQTAGQFPEKVTAFREGMAVHGRFGKACPACDTPIQRIVHAENETHYCARCQTGGKLLADRALSRLLGGDWPRNLEELEELLPSRAPPPLNSSR